MTDTRILSLLSLILLLTTISVTLNSAQAQDIENGKRVFKRCSTCHFVDRKANKVGPSLLNVMGRQAGSVQGFRYSPAMVKAGEDGLIWNRQTLKTYLHSPQATVKGTRMASVRINNDSEIDDLIAYLESFKKDEQ